MESVWDRFDFKGVLCFTGYPDRAKRCAEEFARVGLGGVEVSWFAPNPYDNLLKAHVPLGGYMRRAAAAFNITMHHLAVSKVFLERGAKHALIFEDDVRFLRDADLVREAVRTLPEDFDVAWLDLVPSEQGRKCPDFAESIENARIDGVPLWRRGRVWLRSCGAYALSRRALEAYVDLLERGAKRREELCVCDRHLAWLADPNYGMTCYVARPNVAVQALHRGSCNTDNDTQREGYRILGIDRSNYQRYEEDEP